jgi:hypothetical protein
VRRVLDILGYYAEHVNTPVALTQALQRLAALDLTTSSGPTQN